MSLLALSLSLSLALGLAGSPAPAAAAASASDAPGFLVVAPDRGFLGDEEVRDAFDALAVGRNASLVFVTDERTAGTVDSALQALRTRGARRIVVLPLFLSRGDPRYLRAQSVLAERAGPGVVWAPPFGESYLAVEELAERLREVRDAAKTRVVVVGAGARDADAQRRMLPDWERLSAFASAGLGFESVRTVLEASPARLEAALREAAQGAERTVVVPFHLGSKLDGMMSYSAAIRSAAPAGAEVLAGDVTPDPAVLTWLVREADRSLALRTEDLGVVLLAHGSDYHWNETMRQAVAPLEGRYKIEPAFSMADPVVIERAVRRLEGRGARFIVLVRVFALASSFRDSIEQLIGADVEQGGAPNPHAGHMGHGGEARPPARITSKATFVTVGGVEDDSLFAEALLARARALSREPARETVILVAHGEGDDAANARWRELLASLARQMETKGTGFRAIRTGTWREDWPDKRTAAVEEVKSFVTEAAADGGRAIVIPARVLGQGPERSLLTGLSFELGEGFAPRPEFAQWVDRQIQSALAAERARRANPTQGEAAPPPRRAER